MLHRVGASEYYRERLHEHLDAQGDLAPPWEAFPNYERYTIGWRMGRGEDWLCFWWVFLESLGPDRDGRLAYLRRHAPAPCCWSDNVWSVLHPSEAHDTEILESQRAWLREQGLIAPDVAYATWRKAQKTLSWPWSWNETPADAARYATRDLAFWSRHVAELRAAGTLAVTEAPTAWAAVLEAVHRGAATVDPAQGLLSLSCALGAGEVPPPWQLGLRPEEFQDSFAHDMGYVDAFRLWVMSVFDDAEIVARYLDRAPPPAPWKPWVEQHFVVE
jgi:hypothetical protein